ncbi:MAG: hypothetical protein IPP47_06310 [Bryobacterales bacterium]|nr:hypothetical protein [Bryobacterales bacterium]
MPRFLSIAIVWSALAWGQDAPRVEIDSVSAEGNSRVEFVSRDLRELPPGTAQADGEAIQTASTRDARYAFSLLSVRRLPRNRFYTYTFQLRENEGRRRVFQAEINAAVIGQFVDLEKGVQFHVLVGERRSTGTIQLPLHPADVVRDCRDATGFLDEKPAEVSLTGLTRLTIKLECQSTLEREIRWLKSPEGRHANYWKSLAIQSDYFKDGKPARPVTSKDFVLVELQLEPRPLSALASRVSRLWGKDVYHDRIVLEFGSVLQPAGQLTPHRFEIPVAFQPPYELLALFLGIGVVLGWLVSLSVPAIRSSRGGLPHLGLSVIVALGASVFSLAAYAKECQLKIFGLDMNPFDVVMQFLLGIAVSLLVSNRNWVRTRLKLFAEKALVVVILLASVSGLRAGTIPARLDLIGLSACPGDDIVGLSKDGTLYRFSTTNVGQVVTAGRITLGHEFLELTCTQLPGGGGPVAVVSAKFASFGTLFVMNVATGSWKTRSLGADWKAGVAFDVSEDWLYLISVQSKTIDRLRLGGSAKGPPQYWADVYGDTYSLGSLALDKKRSRLLVGDAYKRNIRTIDLKTKQQKTLVEGVGEMASLSIDVERDVCYVADQGKAIVWSFPLSQQNPKATPFAKGFGADRLSGVAAARDGLVWVSDFTNAKVYVLNSQGKVIRTLP